MCNLSRNFIVDFTLACVSCRCQYPYVGLHRISLVLICRIQRPTGILCLYLPAFEQLQSMASKCSWWPGPQQRRKAAGQLYTYQGRIVLDDGTRGTGSRKHAIVTAVWPTTFEESTGKFLAAGERAPAGEFVPAIFRQAEEGRCLGGNQAANRHAMQQIRADALFFFK